MTEDDLKAIDLETAEDWQVIQYCGSNAQRWADALYAKFPDAGERIDYDTMLGWFANAIEAACDLRVPEAEQAAETRGWNKALEWTKDNEQAARDDERRKVIEECAQIAVKCAEQNRRAEIDCARRGDDIGQDVLKECKHEAEAIGAKIRALAKDDSEADEHLEGAAEQGRVPVAKSL